MIEGEARGILTRISDCKVLAPKARLTSSISAGIWRRPSVVVRMIGGIA